MGQEDLIHLLEKERKKHNTYFTSTEIFNLAKENKIEMNIGNICKCLSKLKKFGFLEFKTGYKINTNGYLNITNLYRGKK